MAWKDYGANRAGRRAARDTDWEMKSKKYKKDSNYAYDAGDYSGSSSDMAKSRYYKDKYQGNNKGRYRAGAGNVAKRGYYRGKGALRNAGRGLNNASFGTVTMVTGGWSQATFKMKGLITLVLAVAILFVPFGIFQYGGWSMYLVFTWVINSFYWFVATIINAILNMFISSIDTIFSYVTELVGGVYQPLSSWTLTTGSLLDPDSFKPTTFDTRYLLHWAWDAYKGTLTDMWNFVVK